MKEFKIEKHSQYEQDTCFVVNIEDAKTGQRVAKAIGSTIDECLNVANQIESAPQLLKALDKASKALKKIKSQLTKEESDEVLNAHLDAERAIKKALGK